MAGDLLESGSESGSENEFELKINKNFEKSYAKKKEREELSRLESKYGDDASDLDESSSDEEEDVDGELVTPELDSQIFQTIAKIKARNPDIYDEKKEFFSEEQMSAIKESWEKKMKERREQGRESITLKQYQREILLENKGKIIDEDAELSRVKTHEDEQKELKREFLSAVNSLADPSGKDELFSQVDAADGAPKDRYRDFLLESLKESEVGEAALNEWIELQKAPNVNPEEAFLMNYVLNRGWMEAPNKQAAPFENLSEDEDDVDRMEQFERKHNFRFEEEGSSKIVTHGRDVPESLRRRDERRKEERERKRQRRTTAVNERGEELRQLRLLRDKELQSKLNQIKEIADLDQVEHIDLEGDFDPSEHDKQLSGLFTDSYYKNASGSNSDRDEDALDIKPVFKDDIDISDIVPKLAETEDTANLTNKQKKKLAKKLAKQQSDEQTRSASALLELANANETFTGDEEQPTSRKEQKRFEKDIRKRIKTFSDYMDYFYPVDCEDVVAGMKTKFRYQSVAKKDYGLRPNDILLAEDKQLNDYLSLKRIAPYRRQDLLEKDDELLKRTKKKKLYQIRKSIREHKLLD